ncbi:MAG TPA: HlyD family secretion protein [Stellaceae bacterium]|jgi:membrane fusion protein (multidrug efflux system)
MSEPSEPALSDSTAEPALATPKQDANDIDPGTAKSAHRRRLMLFGAFAAFVLLVGVGYGIYYLKTGRYIASTDDAYTQADTTTVSPQIAGYIAQALVTDNEVVTKGQLLALIDDRSYRASFQQAEADVAAATAQIDTVNAQIDLQRSQIEQAVAEVASAQSSLTFANQNNTRFEQLSKIGVAAEQTAEQAHTNLDTQAAALVHNRAALDGAQKQLTVLTAQKEAAQATLQRDQAALIQAQINLGYTRVVAPIDGAIGDRSLRPGLYVEPGAKLMSIVPMQQNIYVVANFKETDLTNMFRGQRAEISVDAFPKVTLHGTIDSLAPGSGATFSLLPPENATGNFTKVVQRVPVKILLSADNPVLDRLRPGLSVEVDVDSRTTPPGPRTTLVELAP